MNKANLVNEDISNDGSISRQHVVNTAIVELLRRVGRQQRIRWAS
jgi:hypothetical protein